MGRLRRTTATGCIMKVTNVIHETEHIGLEAVTVLDNKPYFFLFMELDTKDENDLRVVLDFYKKKNLAFLWYESTKGWHVVSPSLLTLRDWDLAKKELAELNLNYYHHLAIRIDKKRGDGQDVYWENSIKAAERKTSSSLLTIYALRFHCSFDSPNSFKTRLNYVKYKQTRFLL